MDALDCPLCLGQGVYTVPGGRKLCLCQRAEQAERRRDYLEDLCAGLQRVIALSHPKKILFWDDNIRPGDYSGTSVAPERRTRAIALLRGGYELHAYRGSASCRLCGCRLGSRDLTNVLYEWPEKAEHYLESHGLWMPVLDEFVTRSLRWRSTSQR